MEKTVASLNSKMWYRLLKVIFILTFLVFLIFFNGIIISEWTATVDKDKTIISCLNDKKFSLKDTDVDISVKYIKGGFDYKGFFEGYNDNEIKKILEECYGTDVRDLDVYALQRTYEITGTKDDKKNYDENYLNSEIKKIEASYSFAKSNYLDYSIHLFSIDGKYNYYKNIGYLIIGNISIFVVFELLRRIFYYVVLGSLKPKKQ